MLFFFSSSGKDSGSAARDPPYFDGGADFFFQCFILGSGNARFCRLSFSKNQQCRRQLYERQFWKRGVSILFIWQIDMEILAVPFSKSGLVITNTTRWLSDRNHHVIPKRHDAFSKILILKPGRKQKTRHFFALYFFLRIAVGKRVFFEFLCCTKRQPCVFAWSG